jgi:hypothetical protein
MKKPYIMLLLCATSFCIALPAAQAKARTSTSERRGDSLATCRALVLKESQFDQKQGLLKDITEVCVLVAPFPRSFESRPVAALSMAEIRKAVENKCRGSGLHVVDNRDWKTPVLSVQLTDLNGPKDGQVAYIERVELRETTILTRDMKERISAALYSFERLECVGELRTSQEEIQTSVLKCVDRFITEWTMEKRQ